MNLEISHANMVEILCAAGVPANRITPADSYYAIAEPGWVTGKCAEAVTSVLKQLGYTYVEDEEDCEDFALRAAVEVKHFHALTYRKLREADPNLTPAGIAFGVIGVASKQHAINFAIHRIGGKWKAQGYEAQPSLGDFGLVKLSLRPFTITREDFETTVLCIP